MASHPTDALDDRLLELDARAAALERRLARLRDGLEPPPADAVVEALEAVAAELARQRQDLAEARRVAALARARPEERAPAAMHAGEVSDEELRLAAIVDSSDDAIVAKSLDGTILSWNPAAERIFGYTRDEIVGRPIFTLIPPELHDEERTILRRINRGERVAHYETERVRRDGKRIRIALTVSPIRTPSGQITGISSIKRDITSQKELEGRLRQAAKMEALGQLAGGIAHDFNNLLTVIRGYGAFLERSLDPADPRRADVHGIQHAAERASSLTQQLLAFSRRQVLQPTLLDVAGVTRDTARMVSRLIGENIQMVVTLAPDLGKVMADAGQIAQIFVNLVVNARDAMPDGGILTIEARNVGLTSHYAREHLGVRPGPYVMLSVSDTGRGMDEQTKARVFEPFFTTKEHGEGTGLGLATVFGIVRQSHGSVTVESRPGLGTTFRIYLPRADETTTASTVGPSPVAARRGTETVLVVEDDANLRELIGRALQEQGYTVLPAADVEEALEVAGRHPGPIDLLVTDVMLPHLTAGELVARLSRTRPAIGVIYVSGYPEDGTALPKLGEAGALFLQKPFTPDQLLRAVRDVLEGRKGGRRIGGAMPFRAAGE